MENHDIEIIYFADPMCSWCWGFSPIINKIVSKLKQEVGSRTIMGGLRPYTSEVMNQEMREYILGHWQNVHKLSGQPFDFEFNIGEDFIYDTEPASRAVVTIREIDQSKEFELLALIHSAFYEKTINVTKAAVLAEIANKLGIEQNLFLEIFNSDELKALTKKDFNTSQHLGIRGFPTLLKRTGNQLEIICQGFISFQDLKPKLEGLFVDD